MQSLQYVTKANKIFSSFKVYILSLLLTRTKKNCASMSYELGISYYSIYRFFNYQEFNKDAFEQHQIALVYLHATKDNPGVLVTDCSQIVKLYAKKLKCLGYDRNGAMKLVVKGLSYVTCAWTNGKVIIPLDFEFWTRKKDLPEGRIYKKKTKISIDLIDKWKNKLPFAYIPLDGDYGNEYCFRYFKKSNLKYSVRIPKSRIVTINSKQAKLKDQFKLKRNEKYKMAKGFYKGLEMYFIAHKRKGPKGKSQIVFIASNLEGLTAKQHVKAYDLRWPIEKMFRTLKQSLGIQDCQSTLDEKQRMHIFATFAAFTKLEILKISKKKNTAGTEASK